VDAYITGGGGGGNSFALLDEDNFASNSAIAAPSQQSTKVYVDTAVAGATTGNDSITNAKLANVATATFNGRSTAGTGDPEDLSVAQALTLLGVEAGATGDMTAAEIATVLEATPGLSYTAIDDLSSAGAGAVIEDALIASGAPASNYFPRRNAAGTALEWVALGTAAYLTAAPVGAPTAASSSSGAITLDFSTKDEIATTTTENITTVTFSNIASYATVIWWVTQTTARTITFPAGTIMKGNGGLLAVAGTANSDQAFLIRNKAGTYVVQVCDAGVVGA
jgi:hypothetical protein